MDTPGFPQWRHFLAPLGRHTARLRASAGATGGLAALFGRCFPGLLVPASQGPGSRRRAFGRVEVFWVFLAQALTRGASCRWALDRLHAEALAAGRPRGAGTVSAYCQARAALPLPWLQSLFAALERWFLPRAKGDWLGRAVRVIDGTAFSMPDTPRNRRRWDHPPGSKPGCAFPAGKLVGLFCLHSGRLLSFVHDTCKTHDLKLARDLIQVLRRGEVLLADRAYCGWEFLARLRRRGVDFVIRLHQGRKVPLRKAGSVEEHWPRPPRGKASRRHWRSLPKGLKVRIVRFVTRRRGFRDHHVIVVTSLLDRKRFPDDAIAELYAQRWLVELHFRQIKTSLALDVMRGLSPAIIERELWMHAIAYNLVRALMLEAALTHETDVARLSFKGALDALAAWTGPALRCRSRRSRARRELLRRIAFDRVPLRPDRTEPRVRKRRPKNYQLMTKPRHRMRVSASRSLK